MTEEQTTNVTNPVTPADATSAAPVATGVPSSSPQPTTPAIDPSDGKEWRTKFYGQKGAYEQLKNQVAANEGALSERITQLQSLLQVSEAEVKRLTLLNSELTGKADAIPQLQTDNQNLKQEAAVAERVKMLLDYPAVLGIQVEEEVPATEEGKEPTMVKINPILNLVANSNLEGDALKVEIARLSKIYGSQAQAQAPPEEPPKGPPVAPAPGTPSEETAEYWRLKAIEISERMNSEGMTPDLMNAHSEAWKKQTELLVSG